MRPNGSSWTIVHRAISVLRELNDDPTHLFGYWTRLNTYALLKGINARLNLFRDHVNELFSTPGEAYIPNQPGPPGDGGNNACVDADSVPWRLSTSQFRRTLAWHIAHQPFGIVAGSRQYQHAELTVFEGYAGTSASGFAAEVASEQAVAKLDYVEDLYRDWNDGKHSGGGATKRVDAEFERIRRDLGDLPGTVASPARLRTMLRHLTKTLHPGTLNDCFYQESTAACSSHAQRLQRIALTEYAQTLTRLIEEIGAIPEERQPA